MLKIILNTLLSLHALVLIMNNNLFEYFLCLHVIGSSLLQHIAFHGLTQFGVIWNAYFIVQISCVYQSSSYLQHWIENQRVLLQYNIHVLWFTICRKVSHRVYSYLQQNQLPFSPSLTEIQIAFAHSFLLPALFYSGTYSGVGGTLACIGQKETKYPIHHGDSTDKHIYTTEIVAFSVCLPCMSVHLSSPTPLCIFHDQFSHAHSE